MMQINQSASQASNGFGRTDTSQRSPVSKFGNANILVCRQLNDLRSRRNLRPIVGENDCSEGILTFLSSFLGRLWHLAVEASFKRVDCPAKPLENNIIDDLSLQTEIERLRTQHEAESTRYRQLKVDHQPPSDETEPTLSKKGKKKKDIDKDLDEDEIRDPKLVKTGELKSGDTKESSSSVQALKDLGLETSLLAGFDDPEDKSEDGSKTVRKISNESAVLSTAEFRRKLAADARTKASADNAVRRKQAKLTREVTVDDLLTALEDESKLPMPLPLRVELIRVLNFMVKASYSSNGTTTSTNPSEDLSFLGCRLFAQNTYIPKQHGSGLSSYAADGAAVVVFPSPYDARGSRLRTRFENVWNTLTTGAPPEGRRSKRKDELGSLTREGTSEKPRSKRKRQSTSTPSCLSIDDSMRHLGPMAVGQLPHSFNVLPFGTPGIPSFRTPNMYFSIHGNTPPIFQGMPGLHDPMSFPYHVPGVPNHFAHRLPMQTLLPGQQQMRPMPTLQPPIS